MNIEQMLRDAIERKTAKILKEEYGIETPKEIADKLSEDDQDYGDYQIRLTNVGDHKIRVVKVVFNNMDVDLKTAKGLVDQAPAVISPGLTFERATETETHISQMVLRCVRQMITSSLRTFGVPDDTLHGPVQTTNGTLDVFVVLVKS